MRCVTYAIGTAVALAWLCAGCGDDRAFRDRLLGADWAGIEDPTPPARDTGLGDAAMGEPPAVGCVPPITSEALPARSAAMADAVTGAGSRGILIADLFGRFVDNCGSCHTGLAAQGGLNVGLANFATRIGPEALVRIRGETPDVFMPPPPLGKPFSERGADDPIVQFAAGLAPWCAAGRPPDVFYPVVDSVDSTDSPYRLSRSVGEQLTNLGSCIPPAEMIMAEATAAAKLDEKFAAMQSFADLPKTLRDTDLSTFDAETLARNGVVAFAPAYTLWADNAKKIRMIRVPVGSSVRFNVTTQRFTIPANTRFYKTFLKPVTDLKGNVRYRKIESRLIVSRPDVDDQPSALFGSYKWNDDETEATLQTTPYRDGHDFADDVFTYIVDERLEDDVLGQLPRDLSAALEEAGASRTYAIPGADRCVHCHMGAPTQDFVLGFSPLQLLRRAEGSGGVIEPAQQHELDQIDRLIAYGVITGMQSSAEIIQLENTQGNRKPRNDYELQAQGYMLGNCAHCHNPRGYPSRREPSLAAVLDFMPSGMGGIFQFPLDKVSPRTFRGDSQRVTIPYISPSLFDLPREALYTNSHGRQILSDQYTEKWISYADPHEGQLTSQEVTVEILLDKWNFQAPLSPGYPLHAPWRSFIYRNVDAPFSYQDGATIFPHMPMDTPGYDCRARAVLGRWMVSIPSRWKHLPEREPKRLLPYLEMADQDPIPHEEVAPDDPAYPEAVALAEERLALFEASPRLTNCPGPELDVLAPEVTRGGRTAPIGDLGGVYDAEGELRGSYSLPGIPARPHYFKTDLRKDAAWAIRRSDWYEVLVENGDDPTKPDSNPVGQAESRDALWAVGQIKLRPELKQVLLSPLPFGLWKTEGKTCDAQLESAGIRTVGSIPAAERPAWMAYAGATDSHRVYDISPGAQVFSTICNKCHGPLADGQSALATTIADLTGGLARVANLREGLFGPIEAPGTGRAAMDKFGRADGLQGLGVDDWAARYVAWMGLSGTNATIPAAALTQIGAAVVLGEEREANIMAVRDESAAANMLSAVKAACELLLPRDARLEFDPIFGDVVSQAGGRIGFDRQKTLEGRGLIAQNGDADLWRLLCTLDNPAPVRVVTFLGTTPEMYNIHIDAGDYYTKLFDRAAYPASAPVGDGADIVAGIRADNAAPWCVQADSDTSFASYEASAGRDLPRCPPELFATDAGGRPVSAWSQQDANRWALRGAANAGIAVFLYLDAVGRGELQRVPAYDRCEELQ
jgi:mono/diheme cytochrome c family protein